MPQRAPADPLTKRQAADLLDMSLEALDMLLESGRLPSLDPAAVRTYLLAEAELAASSDARVAAYRTSVFDLLSFALALFGHDVPKEFPALRTVAVDLKLADALRIAHALGRPVESLWHLVDDPWPIPVCAVPLPSPLPPTAPEEAAFKRAAQEAEELWSPPPPLRGRRAPP